MNVQFISLAILFSLLNVFADDFPPSSGKKASFSEWNIFIPSNKKYTKYLMKLEPATTNTLPKECSLLASVINDLYKGFQTKNQESVINCFDIKKTHKLPINFKLWCDWACQWGNGIAGYGFNKKHPNIAFVATVAENQSNYAKSKPYVSPEEMDDDDTNDIVGRRYSKKILNGYTKIWYLKKTKEGWKVCPKLDFPNLNKLLERELFLGFIRGNIKIWKLQDEIEAIKENRKEDIKEFKEFVESLQKKGISAKKINQNNLFKIYRSLYSDNEDAPSYSYNPLLSKFIKSGKIDLAFKYALKSGEIKVLKKPILFSNINRESGTKTVSNFLNTIKDDLFEWHKNLTSEITFVRKGNKQVMRTKIDTTRTCYQLIAYRELSFKAFFFGKYYTVYGISYNPDNINDRILLSFSSCQQLIYKIGPNGIRELLRGNCIENIYDWLVQDELFSYIPPLNLMKLIDCKHDNSLTIESYNSKIKTLNLYNILRLRHSNECIPYKPGLDFLKLPTVDPKKYNFPELAETLSGN